jgi:hypothetical protein
MSKYIYVVSVQSLGKPKFALSSHVMDEPYFSDTVEEACHFNSLEEARDFSRIFYIDYEEMRPKSGIKVDRPPVIIKYRITYEETSEIIISNE